MKPGEALDITKPISTQYCIPLALRDEQIRINCRKVKDRLSPGALNDSPIAIVGYGPSLKTNWEKIREFKYVITCSGAHKFLLERGIIPTYHLDVDPREHKIQLLGEINSDVLYLPASAVHPKYIDYLITSGAKVALWHIFASDGESDQVIPRGEWAVTGGSDAGMRCMTVARFLGFTNFHIFGLDGSEDEQGRHADEHPNQASGWVATEFNGKTFRTTPALAQCAKQVFTELDGLPDVSFTFYGEGLIQEMAKDYKRTSFGNSRVAIKKPSIISAKMLELNRRLHEEVPSYGMSGAKYAETVIKLKTEEIQSVLDYGCGKGTLAKNLPFPIWEYDPAIPGKEEIPKPADLVVCTDVLEHIEPDKLKWVLIDLKRVTKKLGYFVIHMGPAIKTYANGQNTHLIQEDSEWWKRELRPYFDLAHSQVEGPELHLIVIPKQGEFDMPVIGMKKGETKARYYVPNKTVEWRVKSLFTKEPVTIQWIEQMQPGEVLFDIGANIGMYTCYAGVRGVKVYAFEPESDNYALLNKNIWLNNIDAEAYCFALSNKAELSQLYLSKAEVGGSCHSFSEDLDFSGKPRKGSKTQGCLGLKLDDIELPIPDYIKIDVDGFEHLVIEGGLNYISNAKSLLVELNLNLPAHLKIRDKLVEIGFTYDESQIEKSIRQEGPFKGVSEVVFWRVSGAEKHLAMVIEGAEVINGPYPHIYVENAFPKEYYETILGDIDYRPIKEVRNTNYPARFVGSKEFPELRSGFLKKVLLKKFGLEDQGYDETLLIKDKEGYAIGPHTDLEARILSAIFYLPKEDNKALYHLGTSVYVPKKEGFISDGKSHYQFEDFEKVKTLPYKPNSAFIFLRTPNSFHGVEPTTQERDVLLYDIRK